VVTPADHANTVRRIHRESGPIYGDEGFDAALDALLAQAEASWKLADRLEGEVARLQADRNKLLRVADQRLTAGVRMRAERDQAQDALRQIRDFDETTVRFSSVAGAPGEMRKIARAALSAREEAWTHQDRMVLGEGGC
jgi:hypothetical protein